MTDFFISLGSPGKFLETQVATSLLLLMVNKTFVALQAETLQATSLRLQWDIPMLLRGVLIPLGFQHGQSLDQLLSRITRLNDRVDKAAVCDHLGISEAVTEVFNLFSADLFAICGRIKFALVDDVHRALRPHYRDLR
jgi:uncharacterized protein (UPF0276 family)